MASVNSAEREMNLSALQQRDPYITSIADSASQVAVYSFNSIRHEWEKTNVEGTLFVYSRSANPINGFMIINRLHLNDLIEPINKNLEFQLQDPFLLYRNEKAIYGIWFYDRDECARIGQLMNSLVQITVETQQKESAIGRQRRASESDTTIDSRAIDAGKSIDAMQKNVDIMQMLSKAQDEYDKSKAQILRKSSTPTVTTNGNCTTGVGACSTSPAARIKSISSSKPVQFDNLVGGNGLKPGRVLRPTAVKPTPLHMDSLNRGEGMEPVTTPNTQISLEALFKRAVLQQNGNLQSNSYRNQNDNVQTVPSVAQLMSTQTGTTTVEELERQHQGSSHHADMLGSSASRSFANGAIFSHSLSATGEPECLNTMLRRTLNIDSALAETPVAASGPSAMSRRQASVLEDCMEAPSVHNSARSASRGNDVYEIKASTDVANQHQSDPISQMSLQMSRFGSRKPLDSSSAEMMGPPIITHSGSSSVRHVSNNYKPGVIGSGPVNSIVWSNSPQSDILAPPEAFQAAAPKNDGANILLSPMVFQASSALSAIGQAKLPETDSANLTGSYPACLRSPLGLSMVPSFTLPVNPLTRDQLQQALIYLLKNDSNFLSTIHEAYITSLNQELGSKSMRP